MAKADMFLKLDGLTGEANAPEHMNEIEIYAWSWGMTGSAALGAGGKPARTSLSEIMFIKRTDRATTQLMNVMRNNTKVGEAKLTVRKAGAVPAVEYLFVTVKNGRITSYTIGSGSGGDGEGSPEIKESFTIAFEDIEVKYAPQQTTGSKSGDLTFVTSVK